MADLMGGSLARILGTADVYWVSPDKKYKSLVPSERAFGYMFGEGAWGQVSEISPLELSKIPSATRAIGELVRVAGKPEVYFTSPTGLKHIPSEEAFARTGFKWEDVRIVSPEQLGTLQAPIPAEPKIPVGAVIRQTGTSEVYQVTPEGLKHIETPETLITAGWKWEQIQEVTSEQFSALQGFLGFEHLLAVPEDIKKAIPADILTKVFPTVEELTEFISVTQDVKGMFPEIAEVFETEFKEKVTPKEVREFELGKGEYGLYQKKLKEAKERRKARWEKPRAQPQLALTDDEIRRLIVQGLGF